MSRFSGACNNPTRTKRHGPGRIFLSLYYESWDFPILPLIFSYDENDVTMTYRHTLADDTHRGFSRNQGGVKLFSQFIERTSKITPCIKK